MGLGNAPWNWEREAAAGGAASHLYSTSAVPARHGRAAHSAAAAATALRSPALARPVVSLAGAAVASFCLPVPRCGR